MHRELLISGLIALFWLVPGGGRARAAGQESGSSYARVRYAEGEATIRKTLDGEIVEAGINVPLAPGDRAWTEGGRLEVELVDGVIVWLDEGTHLIFRSLSDFANEYQSTNLLALEEGSLRIELPHPVDDEESVFQIDTEGGSIYPVSSGSYRIDSERGVTTLSSFRGVAELSGDRGSVLVRSGERSSVRAGRTPSGPQPFNTQRLDDFDRFCGGRLDAYLRRGDGAPLDEVEADVPPAVRPYLGELAVYGVWRHAPTYGWVWLPTYSGSWGPYVHGYWSWYPSGWVWISYDPWGWAPYHYGRWDYTVNLGWFWIPGGAWSGAWVSFAVGPAYIGWCPLNYYNYPVFHDVHFVSAIDVRVTHLHRRGWRFAPVGRFGVRDGRHLVKVGLVPRDAKFVVTGRLPRFDPKAVAARPEKARSFVERVRAARKPLKVMRGRSGRLVSFRALEPHSARAADRRVGAPAAGATHRPAAGIDRGGRRAPGVRPGPRRGESGKEPTTAARPKLRRHDGAAPRGAVRAPSRRPSSPRRTRPGPAARSGTEKLAP
ncbi:MAG: DUF6600 domain-containing protein, partial [Acidobacteriota bacterium]